MAFFEFGYKVSKTGELKRCGIAEESHTAQNAAADAQVRSADKKRRRFRWERTIETAFRAYERSGRGREIKSINCYEAIRREFVSGY